MLNRLLITLVFYLSGTTNLFGYTANLTPRCFSGPTYTYECTGGCTCNDGTVFTDNFIVIVCGSENAGTKADAYCDFKCKGNNGGEFGGPNGARCDLK